MTGFAATLFKRAGDGGGAEEYVLAIRGTETEGAQLRLDLLVSDLGEIGFLGLALSQTLSLVNYILRLTGPAGPVVRQLTLASSAELARPQGKDAFGVPGSWYWIEAAPLARGLDLVPAGARITLTGHSLGGHLAAIAARLFPELVNEAYLFNAPGYDPVTASATADAGAITSPFYFLAPQLLRGGAKRLTEAVIADIARSLSKDAAASFAALGSRLHVYAAEDIAPGEDLDIVVGAIAGREFSPATPIAVERNSHAMGQIIDSLALQALFARLGFAGPVEVEALYRAAAADATRTQEVLLSALYELFLRPRERLVLPTVAPGGWLPWIDAGDFGARTDWYEAWAAVRDAIPSTDHGMRLVSLATKSAEDLARDATTDIAHRYALAALNPFAVSGFDYAAHNPAGELALYDPATGRGELTDEWLRDRAELLSWVLVRNRDDIAGVVPNPGGVALELVDRRLIAGSLVQERLRVGASTDRPRTIAFGSPLAEALEGSGDADSLYGGDGEDRLAGLGGDDDLQGDAGNDFLAGGAGDDTLVGGKDTDCLVGGAGADAVGRTADCLAT